MKRGNNTRNNLPHLPKKGVTDSIRRDTHKYEIMVTIRDKGKGY